MLGMLLLEDWTPEGHFVLADLLHWLGRWSAWILLGGFLALLLRAWIRRSRYRAVDVLAAEEVEQIRKEIVKAEKKTVGEIVPMVLERSDAHPQAEWLAALSSLLIGSIFLAGVLPWDHPLYLLALQLLLGGVGFGCARALPDFKRFFISERRATEMAEEQAFQEFHKLGLHETEERTGVLIFVSLLEHRVVVLGDEGVAAKVPTEHWARTDHSILEGIRRGSLRIGLIEGIRRTAEVLRDSFPWREGDRNEIPDRVVVRSE